MKAVGYIRLSNEDQSQYSKQGQRTAIANYCNKYNLTLTDIFEDDGESSYTFDRADFNRLETFIKKNRPQYLIVYHLDRFSRNLAEALLKIKDYLNKYNLRIRDESEPLELDDHDPNTFLMRSFRLMMAESELHRITKRIKDGMQQGALNGRHLNMAPYGYKNTRDANNKPIIVIDDEKAVHVQLIFRQFIAGHNIETVRHLAAATGFKRKGNSAIAEILKNQVYTGKVKLPKSGEYVKGLHEPIISEFEFWQVQKMLEHRPKKKDHPKEEVFLRGVLHDHSGSLMTAGNSKGRSGAYYWYYVSKITRQHYNADKLHQQFYALLSELNIPKSKIAWLKEKATTAINDKIKTQAESIRKLSLSLQDVRNKVAMAEEKYLMDPEMSQASYRKSIATLRQKESTLEAEIMNAEQPATHLMKKLDTLLPALTNVKAYFDKMPLERKQQFIRAVFDNSLAYYNDSYRTAFIHPLFSFKATSLKENRLLIFEQPVIKIGELRNVLRQGELSNHDLLDSINTMYFLLTG